MKKFPPAGEGLVLTAQLRSLLYPVAKNLTLSSLRQRARIDDSAEFDPARLSAAVETGGADGIRDLKVIESALARPLNVAAYGSPDAADLAAVYAHGLANNHGFVDGNRRTAWVTARLFLADNGQRLEFDPLDAIRTMEDVAGGRIGETDLAGWFRRHVMA